MAQLQAQYWSNAQKFKFIADAGPVFTVQTNPSTYSKMPNNQQEVQFPAQLGPAFFNGAIEMAPTSIPLEWVEMSSSDYDALSSNFHLQPCTMIDMEDQGFYGFLKLGGFDYQVGSAQKVGIVKAVFVCIQPANGQTSVINTLGAPAILTGTIGTGGTISNSTTMYYRRSVFSNWGESLAGPVFTIITTNASASIILPWTAPSSGFYRKSRIYSASTAGALANGLQAVCNDILYGFSQQWIDTVGIQGTQNQAYIPAVDHSATGFFLGGKWQNKT
jgi:hypothetical protein